MRPAPRPPSFSRARTRNASSEPVVYRCCRVEVEVFHKAENAVTYTFNKEDHTIGNLLRVCVAFFLPRTRPPPSLANFGG